MDNTKIKNTIQQLANIQSQCQELIDRIREIEKEIEQDNESKFERVPKGESYYTVDFECGIAFASTDCEDYVTMDDFRFDNNNYFKTCERAQEVADKINFLLKLERLHDTFCSNYVPDFNDFSTLKYTIYCDRNNKMYKTIPCYSAEHRTQVYFPSEEIAQKVCDILNKESPNGI